VSQAALAHAVQEPVLRFSRLSKTFGGTRALQSIDLDVAPGEVHGLVGHNGSGKSTLIKVLAAYHEPDAGAALAIGGSSVTFPATQEQIHALGVRFVHQDLGLIPALSVAENLLLGSIAAERRRHSGVRRLRREAAGLLARYGLDLDPAESVSTLSAVERANLAIVRAVGGDLRGVSGAVRLIVLDEPTAFLPAQDKQHLYQLIRQVVAQGSSVLFVSHFLDEVIELCDRVTVLRDGRVVAHGLETTGMSTDTLVAHIVGDDNRRERALLSAPSAGTYVDVRGLNAGRVRDMSFAVARGEILGVTGLLGSGFEDVPPALFGAVQATGEFDIDGRTVRLKRQHPHAAVDSGIAFIPADRNREGIVPSLDVSDNISLLVLRKYLRSGLLRRGRIRNDAGVLLADFGVRPRLPGTVTAALSGGNAQKVLLAKWLRCQPKLLLLVEPTQGVDVTSRLQIEQMLATRASQGMSVICATADPEQLEALCHRVLVMHEGRVAAELIGAAVNKHDIAETCLRSGGRPAELATSERHA
jgi:ribose transport system ATP-binding protein